MLNNLLMYRLMLFNGAALALLIWAFVLGWPQFLLSNDVSHIGYVMITLFVVGMLSLFTRATKVTSAMNLVKSTRDKSLIGEDVKHKIRKFPTKAGHLEDIANWLVVLGLIGNIVGFAIALYGLRGADIGSADAAQKVVVGLLSGLAVAFYTTLIGALLGLWMDINRRLLKTATELLLQDLDR